MNDYTTADICCRINYANVFDPIDVIAGEYDVDDRLYAMGKLVEIWLLKEPDYDEIVEKALGYEAIDLSRKLLTLSRASCLTHISFAFLHKLYQVLLKANQLTEETKGLLRQLVGDANIYFDDDFYLRLYNSLPIGENNTLVQENI